MDKLRPIAEGAPAIIRGIITPCSHAVWDEARSCVRHLHGDDDLRVAMREAEAHRIWTSPSTAESMFFDTAENYPVPPKEDWAGVTEEIVGRWLKTKRRTPC